MQKGWSIFFGVILLATFLIWFAAPFFGWWLPENISTFGGGVDNLFYAILGLTTFFFVLTEVVLVYAMWKFVDRGGEKSVYTHGNHTLELVWTAIPAALLLGIAIAQIGVWEKIKYQSRMPAPDLTVSVLARQWEWRMRYPLDNQQFHYEDEDQKAASNLKSRLWAENPNFDDVHAINELHVWKNANVKLWIRTLDVLHSFTLPNLRLKQDTLPGKTIPMWFNAEKSNCEFVVRERSTGKPVTLAFNSKTKLVEVVTPSGREPLEARVADLKGELETSGNKADNWEIACQELCGSRHYAMRGRLYVHADEKSYYAWLQYSRGAQKATSLEAAVSMR